MKYSMVTVVDPWNMQNPPLQEIPLNAAHYKAEGFDEEPTLDAKKEDMSQRPSSTWRSRHNSKTVSMTRTRRY